LSDEEEDMGIWGQPMHSSEIVRWNCVTNPRCMYLMT